MEKSTILLIIGALLVDILCISAGFIIATGGVVC